MRHFLAIASVAVLLGCSPARVMTGSPEKSPAPPVSNNALVPAPRALAVATAPATSPRVEFATQVRPILEARCMPCHFEGGKMYDRLPFDRPQTIRTLGTKLFTRISDPAEKEIISAFLSDSPLSCADQ